jgi:hypothetical protein
VVQESVQVQVDGMEVVPEQVDDSHRRHSLAYHEYRLSQGTRHDPEVVQESVLELGDMELVPEPADDNHRRHLLACHGRRPSQGIHHDQEVVQELAPVQADGMEREPVQVGDTELVPVQVGDTELELGLVDDKELGLVLEPADDKEPELALELGLVDDSHRRLPRRRHLDCHHAAYHEHRPHQGIHHEHRHLDWPGHVHRLERRGLQGKVAMDLPRTQNLLQFRKSRSTRGADYRIEYVTY